ncbi:protein PRR14L isoform X1 [Pelobates fuscus]|uniref:protein PRR14L isoform X1 n=1 Tax=Pelobates fuscus TaxID=191477 RepID=UPI002FE4B538
MLGLGALERSQLLNLESPVHRTIAEIYPVLHVQLINSQDLRTNLGQKPLVSDVHERNRAISSDDKDSEHIPAPEGIGETGDQGSKDWDIISVDVMLGTVERGGSLEISPATQRLLLQESVEPSALHVATGFLDISIHSEHPDLLPRKDEEILDDSVLQMSAKAAGMVAMGAGAVVHSEQSERVCIHQADTHSNECPESDSTDILSQMSNLITTQPQTLSGNSSEEHVNQESSVSTSYSDKFFPLDSKSDIDAASSALCLEDPHLPLHCSALNTLNNVCSKPTDPSSKPVESEIMCITEEAKTSSFLSESLRACVPDNEVETNSGNVLEHAVLVDSSWSSGMSDHQMTENVSSTNSQNHQCSEACHFSPIHTKTADACTEHVIPQDSSKSSDIVTSHQLLVEEISEAGDALEASSNNPSQALTFEHVLSAKADREECPCSLSTVECRINNLEGSIDCKKQSSLVRDAECLASCKDIKDCSMDMDHSPSLPSTKHCEDSRSGCYQTICKTLATAAQGVCESLHGNPNHLKMTEELCQVQDTHLHKHKTSNEASPVTFVVHTVQENEETSFNSKGIERLVTCSQAQLQSSSIFELRNPINPALLTVDAHSLKCEDIASSESLASTGINTESGKVDELLQQIGPPEINIHELSRDSCCMLSSQRQDTLTEAHLKSNSMKEGPYQSTGSKKFALTSCVEATPLNALVPYVDILGSLVVPKVPTVQSMETSEPLLSFTSNILSLEQEILDDIVLRTDKGQYFLEQSSLALTGKTSDQSMEVECIEEREQNEPCLPEYPMADYPNLPVGNATNSLTEKSNCPHVQTNVKKEKQENSQMEVPASAEVIYQPALSPTDLVDERDTDALSVEQDKKFCVQTENDLLLFQSYKDVDHCADVLPAGTFSNSMPFCSVKQNKNFNKKQHYNSTVVNLLTPISNVVELSLDKQLNQIGTQSIDLKPYTESSSTNELVSECKKSFKDFSYEGDQVSMSSILSVTSDNFPLVSSVDKQTFGRTNQVVPAETVQKQIKQKWICAKTRERVSVHKVPEHLEKNLLQENISQAKLSKPSISQSTSCDEKNISFTTRQMKNKCKRSFEHRTVIQCLGNNAPQEVRVQHICSSQDALFVEHKGILQANNDMLKDTPCSAQDTTSLYPHPLRECSDKGLSAFNSGCPLSKILPMKRQPSRKCKSAPVLEYVRVPRPSKICKSAAIMKAPALTVSKDDCRIQLVMDTTSKLFGSQCTTQPSSLQRVQRGVVSAYMRNTFFQKCTKDQTLLHQLSSIASKLMTPFKSSRQQKYPCLSGAPFGGVQFQARKLLEVFSCVNMKLSSPAGEVWSETLSLTGGRGHLLSQPPDLFAACPPHPTINSISNSFALKPIDHTSFPISFHIKLNSNDLPDFVRVPFCTSKRPTSTTLSPPLNEWTFSLSLSPHFPVTSENMHLFTQCNPHFRPFEAHDSGSCHRISSVKRGSGCSIRGLHTILALSSPGCYRLWTRRRNLGSRIPTIQRLSMSQFAQGIQDLKSQVLPTRKPLSLPYSLGRVLSTWSQHGPSSSSSPTDFTTPHLNCSVWHPGLLSNIRHPHPSVGIPKLLLNTGPSKLDIYSLAEERSLHAVVPKTSEHQDNIEPQLGLSSTTNSPVRPFEQRELLPSSCVRVQSTSQEVVKDGLERKPQRVSQIRIRKTVPRPDPNLTPMGLPKAKRINKKEFSLEDIYTNKNYKSPPAARSLETIFEEPKEKNGILVSISQQKRKRILEFRDCTVPKLKRARGKTKIVTGFKRGRKAAMEEVQQLDALLVKKLMDLENFLLEEEAVERTSKAAEIQS